MRLGEEHDLYLEGSLTVPLLLSAVVPIQRIWKRGVRGDAGTWKAIPFRCPSAKVNYLTSFRAEGAPGITLPCDGLATEWAGHTRHCTTLNPRIGQRSTLGDVVRGRDVQQSVQAALIDLREAEKFDPEFPAHTPTNRSGLDGNGRTQIRRPDENSHR